LHPLRASRALSLCVRPFPAGGDRQPLPSRVSAVSTKRGWPRAEKKVAKERLELFRALIDHSNDIIEIVEPETGRLLDFNERACQELGYSRDELLSKSVFDLDPTVERSLFTSSVEEMRKSGALVWDGVHERRDGSRFPVEVNIKRVQLDRDYLVAVVRNLTERKRVDQQLHMLSRAVEQSPVIVVITDRQGRIEYVNPQAVKETGYTAEELIGANPRIFKSGRTRAKVYEGLWKTITSGREWRGEFHNRKKDGESYWVSASIGPITNAAGRITHFIATEENITARKESEEALQRSEARYRSLVEGATYGIYRSGVDGRFIDVNSALVGMLGYDSESELLALDPATDVYQETGDSRELAERLARKSRVQMETVWKRKDGSQITVALSGRLVSLPSESDSVEVMVEDVTERQRLERQFRQAQKMEAVGQLAGGVAHDFNNLLTVIGGYVDLLQENPRLDGPMRRDLTDIRSATDRAASLTRQLLAFSRRQMLQPVVLDLNEVIVDLRKMLERVIGEDVHLLTKLHPALGRVRADPGQIEQVLINLVVNARDAMPGGGKLTLETTNVELDEDYSRRHVAAEPGAYVMFSVSDDGSGMDEETRSRIFEPFFTTKERGKGTGLGLSTVFGIVKQTGGFIWVYSELGQGTTFKIYLPRVDEPASRVELSRAEKDALVGTETILLVEDEESLRTLAARILGQCGYRVLTATEAAEALVLSQRHEGPIHLMVTDVVMPQTSGPELAKRLGILRPEMKVLYMSGYAENGIVHHGVLQEDASFLQKPFDRKSLARKVRKVLDSPGQRATRRIER